MKDFIKLVIYSFFRLFPIKQNKIICNNFLAKGYGDNPKYIVEELLKNNSRYDIVWLCEEKYNFTLPKNVRCVNNTIKYLYEFATAKIWISNVRLPKYLKKRKKQFYIQTWHGGIALKRIEKDAIESLSSKYIKMAKEDSKKADIMISNSQFLTNLYNSSFWYEGPILEKGLPRNDILINNNFSTKKYIEKKYNLKGYKVLLYAPTFRKTDSREAYNLPAEELIKFLEKKTKSKWKILVKFHPNVKSTEYIEFNKSIIDCSDFNDLNELFSVTDILITDYSSCMFDFMILNKPVFLYATDIEAYKKDRNFYFPLESTPFTISKTHEELINNMDMYLNKDFYKIYKKFYEKHGINETGFASNEVCKVIDRVINKNIKFSIIIPVYNVEKYIEKCLDSILNQTYENYEVIIVNDGTLDNSQKLIDKYVKKDNRFLSYKKENGGLSDARNYGVKRATGDYIIFIDSDDYIEKDLLKNLNDKIIKNYPQLVRYNLTLVDENYNVILSNDKVKSFGNKKKNIVRNKYVEPAWLYAYRTDFYKKNNFEFPKGKIHEDFYLTLFILDKAKTVEILNYNGYNYVQRDNSIMTNKNYDKIVKRVNDFLEHNQFHKKTIKNKYILSYSNKSVLFKIKELKSNDLKNQITKIKLDKKNFDLKPLGIKDFIYNIYFKKNYEKIINKKNNEFYKEC